MYKKAAIIFNNYYFDDGMKYIQNRFENCFNAFGIELQTFGFNHMDFDNFVSYGLEQKQAKFDFVIFWDKQVALARQLESMGVKVFNCSDIIEICDDKQKTYGKLAHADIKLIPTIVSPLVYDNCPNADDRFLNYVEEKLCFPIVVKECIGSQGRQVYLASDKKQLKELNQKLLHIPHIYQKFICSSLLRESSKSETLSSENKIFSDVRVYVVGGEVVGCMERQSTTDFKSNVACGGAARVVLDVPSELADKAKLVSNQLNLDFGALDFIHSNDEFYFVEANSNAYFKAIESLGVDICGKIVEYISCKIQ